MAWPGSLLWTHLDQPSLLKSGRPRVNSSAREVASPVSRQAGVPRWSSGGHGRRIASGISDRQESNCPIVQRPVRVYQNSEYHPEKRKVGGSTPPLTTSSDLRKRLFSNQTSAVGYTSSLIYLKQTFAGSRIVAAQRALHTAGGQLL